MGQFWSTQLKNGPLALLLVPVVFHFPVMLLINGAAGLKNSISPLQKTNGWIQILRFIANGSRVVELLVF